MLLGCGSVPGPSPIVIARPDALLPGPCASVDGGGAETRYAYDEVGRLTQRLAGGVRTRHVYDSSGRRAFDEIQRPGAHHRVWYVYDDDGVLIAAETDRSGARDVVRREEREYVSGRLVARRSVAVGTNDVVLRSTKLMYSAGALTRVEHYGPGGALTRAIEVETDAIGRVARRRDVYGGTTLEHYGYERGRLALRTVHREGALWSRREYDYDAHGNLLEERESDAAGRVIATTSHDYSCWPASGS